jgi:hypothetical protein
MWFFDTALVYFPVMSTPDIQRSALLSVEDIYGHSRHLIERNICRKSPKGVPRFAGAKMAGLIVYKELPFSFLSYYTLPFDEQFS